jgi:hypothetical protein
VAGIVLIDLGVFSAQIARQVRVLSIEPAAQSRMNAVYMLCYYLGPACSSAAGVKVMSMAGTDLASQLRKNFSKTDGGIGGQGQLQGLRRRRGRQAQAQALRLVFSADKAVMNSTTKLQSSSCSTLMSPTATGATYPRMICRPAIRLSILDRTSPARR